MSGWVLLVAALLGAGASAAPTASSSRPDRWQFLPESKQNQLLLRFSRVPLRYRLIEVSERFLGTRYSVSPLGEGSGIDPDPTFRLDAVDCLTFVEETIALSLSSKMADVEPTLRALRYYRKPTYADRNHLMEAQWLPHNRAKGFLSDVTARYGGAQTQAVVKRLTARSWASPSARALLLPKERRPTGVFPLSIIPLAKVLEKAPAVPSGTVVVVVREDRPFKVTRVTHVGFLLHRGKQLFLRHATSQGRSRVVDEELEAFLGRAARSQSWKVVGVSLYEVRSPAARTARR